MFLTFFLIVRILLGLPTAFQANKKVDFFCKNGCFQISSEKERTVLDDDRTVIALCDAPPAEALLEADDDSQREWPILFASSPKDDLFKKFVRQRNARKVYMDIWSVEEITLIK
jgi:hypothetical protein